MKKNLNFLFFFLICSVCYFTLPSTPTAEPKEKTHATHTEQPQKPTDQISPATATTNKSKFLLLPPMALLVVALCYYCYYCYYSTKVQLPGAIPVNVNLVFPNLDQMDSNVVNENNNHNEEEEEEDDDDDDDDEDDDDPNYSVVDNIPHERDIQNHLNNDNINVNIHNLDDNDNSNYEDDFSLDSSNNRMIPDLDHNSEDNNGSHHSNNRVLNINERKNQFDLLDNNDNDYEEDDDESFSYDGSDDKIVLNINGEENQFGHNPSMISGILYHNDNNVNVGIHNQGNNNNEKKDNHDPNNSVASDIPNMQNFLSNDNIGVHNLDHNSDNSNYEDDYEENDDSSSLDSSNNREISSLLNPSVIPNQDPQDHFNNNNIGVNNNLDHNSEDNNGSHHSNNRVLNINERKNQFDLLDNNNYKNDDQSSSLDSSNNREISSLLNPSVVPDRGNNNNEKKDNHDLNKNVVHGFQDPQDHFNNNNIGVNNNLDHNSEDNNGSHHSNNRVLNINERKNQFGHNPNMISGLLHNNHNIVGVGIHNQGNNNNEKDDDEKEEEKQPYIENNQLNAKQSFQQKKPSKFVPNDFSGDYFLELLKNSVLGNDQDPKVAWKEVTQYLEQHKESVNWLEMKTRTMFPIYCIDTIGMLGINVGLSPSQKVRQYSIMLSLVTFFLDNNIDIKHENNKLFLTCIKNYLGSWSLVVAAMLGKRKTITSSKTKEGYQISLDGIALGSISEENYKALSKKKLYSIEIKPKEKAYCKIISKDVLEKCSFCLEFLSDQVAKNIPLKIVSCGDIFCRDCISLWVVNNNKCPNCNTLLPLGLGNLHDLTDEELRKKKIIKAKDTLRLLFGWPGSQE